MFKVIGYLSYGFPNIEESIHRAEVYYKAGCRCIEVDIPSNDPYMDNEFIQLRMKSAYKECSDANKYFEGIKTIQNRCPEAELIILSYAETVQQVGVGTFAELMKSTNLKQMILVGKEAKQVGSLLTEKGIKISSYISFAMEDEEINNAMGATAFIYLQAKSSGIYREGCDKLEKCIDYLRNAGIKLPIYCGVGVSTPEDIMEIKKAGGDGAFIGSALLKQENDDAIIKYLQSLVCCA